MNRRSFLTSLIVGLISVPFINKVFAKNKGIKVWGEKTIPANPKIQMPNGIKKLLSEVQPMSMNYYYLNIDMGDGRYALVFENYSVDNPFTLVVKQFKDVKRNDIFKIFSPNGGNKKQIGKIWLAMGDSYKWAENKSVAAINCIEFTTMAEAYRFING